MTAEKTDALKPYLQLLLSVMNEMFAGLRFANKKTQQIALSRLQKRMEAVSAKLSSEDVDFDIDDNDNGQEAAPDEQTTAVKRRQLTDAEILENKSFMPEKPEDLAYVPGLIGGYGLKNINISFGVMNFHLQDIEPMVWNDKACEHLVYDPQQKDLVLSFVESHGRASTLQRYVMTLEGMESCIKVTNPQAGKSQGSKDDNGGLYG
ncbi:uncharacterized protein G6M90_00g069670 [Metarhizium brunneum]|uniref:Uncharacterized protein n=1 Tax=Metarhizium brunneum TaxID=500148 RepID=A0A7D5Z8C7_9HYPO|nr:hypothetical protein G6M90_00g069670 [Metarhizium brunneum]